MAAIPQKELRNNVGEVLRRAEAGERLTITVSGRPVAELGPARTRQWVDTGDLQDLWDLPPDPTLADDLEGFESGPARPLGVEPAVRAVLDTSVLIGGDALPAGIESSISTVSIAELHYGLLVAPDDDARALRVATTRADRSPISRSSRRSMIESPANGDAFRPP